MLESKTLRARLQFMKTQTNPGVSWDENCEGSARALVIFVGPSPGGSKPTKRTQLKTGCVPALWNQVYDRPLTWSPGFQASFKPLVEAVLGRPYNVAGKLIGRANMDWISNPESSDVEVRYMWDGRHSVLQMLRDAQPELIIPMDEKTFNVLQIAMYDAGFTIHAADIAEFTVRMSSGRSPRYHRRLHAFRSRSPDAYEAVLIKAPQHPARIFDSEYARRCGEALREAANQIFAGETVNVKSA